MAKHKIVVIAIVGIAIRLVALVTTILIAMLIWQLAPAPAQLILGGIVGAAFIWLLIRFVNQYHDTRQLPSDPDSPS